MDIWQNCCCVVVLAAEKITSTFMIMILSNHTILLGIL
ncbi:Uncharacterised protein [Vibrio cholerae]|nr:Uncharacterised protein [Vibrio cholerae]